jgi:hypothetical protein
MAVSARAEVHVSAFDDGDDAEWDEFITRAPMATFLHSRRFLNYHGDRFTDQSLVLREKGGKLVGVFPAATDPADNRHVVSHPGITFGGVVHDGSLGGASMVDALTEIRDHYAEQGFQALRYKAVPHIYHLRPSADDVYALTRLGAQLYRCDLSSAIDLTDRGKPSERRRRGARKALSQGVEVGVDGGAWEEFWPVLDENLRSRHAVRPTHTVDEIKLLQALFPEVIELVIARMSGSVLGGVVLFKSDRVVHAQYIAATEEGRVANALDALFEDCISRSALAGARYFDFGVSTVEEGRTLNAGLHKFKSEFGGGGVAHLFYELGLEPRSSRPNADLSQS